ncbi:hypothetical protein ACHAQA_009552 [Verticillium albo-atrum]
MDPLPVYYDAVVYAEYDDESSRWEESLIEPTLRELEPFVTELVDGRGPAKLVLDGTNQGSYNRVLRFRFASGGSDVALKFPMPGRTAPNLWQEKVANEAAWLQFLEEKTAVPVPHVYSSGILPTSLGLPYILMDWVSGVDLRSWLKDESQASMRPFILQQMASIYLELYHLPLKGIGSIAKDGASGEWAITRRPLTIDMHQFTIGIHEFPTRHWPTGPLENSSEYFDLVLSQHKIQLWSLRNLNSLDVKQGGEDEDGQPDQACDSKKIADMARRRFKARYGFEQLVRKFCNQDCDLAATRIFCPDLDPRNVLVDPETGIITGLVDFEFTNAMPAQFAQDPPPWLFSILPAQCLDMGFFPWFQLQYEPRLHEFLEAMKQAEKNIKTKAGQEPLSSLMRSSWETGSIWFNYAATNSDHVDSLYYEVLRKYHLGAAEPVLPLEEKIKMESYVEHAQAQASAYEDACTRRLAKTNSTSRPCTPRGS